MFCFVILAFEIIFAMKRITYRKYIEKDVVACFPSNEIYLLSFVVCMLSQNVVLHAFKGCCLHAFPK